MIFVYLCCFSPSLLQANFIEKNRKSHPENAHVIIIKNTLSMNLKGGINGTKIFILSFVIYIYF